jgi:acetyl esterase
VMRAEEIAALRAGARGRASARRPGPPMPTLDEVVDGVPVRRYHPGAGPVVVYLHGGGFLVGDLDTHDAQVRRLAAATGASVVAVDYRRAPEHPFPAAIDDAVAVAARQEGAVALAGDSAGGMIAVLAALRLRGRLPLLAQLLVCPNADGSGGGDYREWVELWLPDQASRAAADLLTADLRGLPPALVVTAEHDSLRGEGDAYARRLAEAGVPVVHRCEPGLEHNFPSMRDTSPAAAAAEDRFLADAAALLNGRPTAR